MNVNDGDNVNLIGKQKQQHRINAKSAGKQSEMSAGFTVVRFLATVGFGKLRAKFGKVMHKIVERILKIVHNLMPQKINLIIANSINPPHITVKPLY